MDKVKLHIVDFRAGGDGVTAIYIDGKLHKYGDYYHDKIDDWIRGFKDGLEFAKVEIEEETIGEKEGITDDSQLYYDVSEMAMTPPQTIKELKEKINEHHT